MSINSDWKTLILLAPSSVCAIKHVKSVRQNVGFVVPGSFIPPTKGGERVSYDLCHALTRVAHVTCFSADAKGVIPDIRQIKAFGPSQWKYLNVKLVKTFFESFRRHKIDFCIVNQPFFFFIPYLSGLFSGCKIITYAHNLEFRRADRMRLYFRPFIFLIELIVFHLSHKVFFISSSELTDAQRLFRLRQDKCVFVPHIAHAPPRAKLAKKDRPNAFSLVFFGDFSYPPNINALNNLLKFVTPILSQMLTFRCSLVVFGKNVPSHLKNHNLGSNLSISFLGFVQEPSDIVRSADALINLVDEGAGVQTKIIETLAVGTSVISSRSGARGIDNETIKDKVYLVNDRDWKGFATCVCELRQSGKADLETPALFFNTYSADGILDRITHALSA